MPISFDHQVLRTTDRDEGSDLVDMLVMAEESVRQDEQEEGTQEQNRPPGSTLEENHRSDAHSDLPGRYLEQIGKYDLLSAEEEHRIATLARQGNFEARQKMIEHNLRLVVFVAKQYQHKGLPFLDVIEEGNLGLIQAIERFDPERGFRFSTYAAYWIRDAIDRALSHGTRPVRLPVHVRRNINTVLRVKHAMEEKHANGKEAPLPDLARQTGHTVRQVKELLGISQEPRSLNASVGKDSPTSLIDMLPAAVETAPDTVLEQLQHKNMMHTSLKRLPPNQRFVIGSRFGLWGGEPQTVAAVAQQMGVSTDRVRQLQNQAMGMLRREIQRSGWEH